MKRTMLKIRLLADELLYQADRVNQHDGTIRTEVNNLVTERFQTCDDSAGDVFHVRVIARGLFSIAVDGDRFSLADPLHKSERAHIRSSRGPIDGKEAENRRVNIVEMMITVAECLRAFFGGGVR